jgi:hypothetical protein
VCDARKLLLLTTAWHIKEISIQQCNSSVSILIVLKAYRYYKFQKIKKMENTQIENKAKLIRKWCLVSTTEAGSGHPTSCLSAADLTSVLFDRYFTYDINEPLNFI